MAYVFDPDRLHALAQPAVGLPPDEMLAALERGLLAAYPDHVHTDQRFLFSLFGGSTGIMKVFHASLREYLTLFGSPLGTNGFSGRYPLTIYDSVLSGEMSCYQADAALARADHRPGDHARLDRLAVKGWALAPGTWMLEYGRGFMPGALPGALAGALTSAFDPVTVVDTLAVYGRLTLRALRAGR